jgi:hypothetical protein
LLASAVFFFWPQLCIVRCTALQGCVFWNVKKFTAVKLKSVLKYRRVTVIALAYNTNKIFNCFFLPF